MVRIHKGDKIREEVNTPANHYCMRPPVISAPRFKHTTIKIGEYHDNLPILISWSLVQPIRCGIGHYHALIG
jgi:hypothetical protein